MNAALRAGVAANRDVTAPGRAVSIVCDVIGRTGCKIRLRARVDVKIELDLGEQVLVDATIDGDTETVAATVIGRPTERVVEIECCAEIWATKVMTVRRRR